MKFEIARSVQILERTPVLLESFLTGLDDEWVTTNEGPGTWSVYDIAGHLLHGEKTDWVARMNMILEKGESGVFAVFEREAMFHESAGKSLSKILTEFKLARGENLAYLLSLHLTEADLDKRGTHPKFGSVTLRQLLSTWTIHDLVHLAQISRVMAKQYRSEIGPWLEYIRLLQ